MSKLCDKLEAFADGNLPPAEAREFSDHLAECPRCQAGLTGLLQLQQLGRQYLEAHGLVEVPWYVVPRYQWGAAGAALAICAVLVLVFVRSAAEPPMDTRALWVGKNRSIEARVTYRAADEHRPLQRMMGAERDTPVAEPSRGVVEALRSRNDLQQLAAAYLAAERPDPESARKVLEQLKEAKQGELADILSDLGAAHYTAGEQARRHDATDEYVKALESFEQALRRKPSHVQALWNRGLVYRKLGFSLLALQDFNQVASQERDPDWREEARDKVEELSRGLGRKDRWKKAQTLGDALSAGGARVPEEALTYVNVASMRRDFYDAVRSRTSRKEVLELLPLAEKLDAQASSGAVLADYVRRIASRDFTRRAPLVQRYAQVVSGKLGERERAEQLAALIASGEDDLVVGALVNVITLFPATFPKYAELLIERAASIPDPWFALIASQQKAKVAERKGDHGGATRLLLDALDLCMKSRMYYRCVDIENDLSHNLAWLFRLDEAEAHARAGLNLARQTYQWDKETLLLQARGNVSRERFDVTLGRAYYQEALQFLNPNDLRGERNIRQNLAHLAIVALDLDEARVQIDRAMEVGAKLPGSPLTSHGAAALVDIARSRPSPHDAEVLRRVLEAEPGETVGQRAYAKFLLGRFTIETNAAVGKQRLEQAIQDAQPAVDEDIFAQHARAYSFTSLIFEEAKRGDFEAALRRFGEELGFEAPGQCVLALTEDTERSLLIVRGADGQLLRDYQANRTERLPGSDLTGIVMPRMVEALRSCARVDALVRPPLQGRAGLLPPEIAWSYRTRAAPPRAPEGKPVCLTVSNVQYDVGEDAENLSWEASPCPGEAVGLHALEATPSRVLEELRDATDVDMATHGRTGPRSNTSFLLLARDTDGETRLYADRIRRAAKLRGAPLVVLAACEAARGTSALHELDSLPNAFLQAGARSVVAATRQIPDKDSARFFANVRRRVREDVPVSIAVRDEKREWKGEDAKWLEGILVFE